jgi:hypothetical protein
MVAPAVLAGIASLAATAASPAPAAGQIAWDSPPLVSPAAPSRFSVFIVNPSGGDLGALLTFRHSAGAVGLGYRTAISDESGSGDIAFSAGIDVSGLLARGVEGSEIDLMWWSGGGVGIGSETIVTFPLGLILGWTGQSDGVGLSPYGGGHLVLDLVSGPGDAVRLDAVFDLGLDLQLSSGWTIRVGFSLGDRESLALGVRLPGG